MPQETQPLPPASFINKKVALSLALILVVGVYVVWQRMSSPESAVATTPATPEVVGRFRDGTYTGNSVDSIFGQVQVQAVVKGGALVNVIGLVYPNDRETSTRISNESLSVMTKEAIEIQSADVDLVSGATQTWEAYVVSLDSALKLAAR
ncbi:MAG: FMN-binding protein [Patescibacteria group bacterium]